MHYLSNQQKRIVFSNHPVQMVIAGPGSGKTYVLTQKVIHILKQGVSENEIILLTFTNKASKNMLNRIEKCLGYRPGILGGTFHHIANKFLRENAHFIGYKKNYSIIDERDSVDLLKRVLNDHFHDVGDAIPKPRVLHKIISYCKNSKTSISSYLEANLKGYMDQSYLINEIMKKYDDRKKLFNMMDFDDLLIYFNTLLSNKNFRCSFQNKFTHIFVDEFQDTNRIQFDIVLKMHKNGNNLFVVGDDCQSIYAFRAADVRNMLNFKKWFNNAKFFYLTENYRSSKAIISLVNEIIANNVNKFEKNLKSVSSLGFKQPRLNLFNDLASEANYVADKIEGMIKRNCVLPSEIAVLYRSNYQSAHIEMELLKRGIKYVKFGGLKFFEQSHIKDVLAFLKVCNNMDDEIAWLRILKLFDGIGDMTASAVFSRISGLDDAHRALSKINDSKLNQIRELIKLSINKSPADAIGIFLDEFYKQYIKKKYGDSYDERIEDIEQLLSIASEYDLVDKFISDSLLDANLVDVNEPNSRIILSTIHQAKGLEWDNVFIVGLVQGAFPTKHSLHSVEKLEEERRLFYVACSRARTVIELCAPLSNNEYFNSSSCVEVSQFVSEVSNLLKSHDYASKENSDDYSLDFLSADNLL